MSDNHWRMQLNNFLQGNGGTKMLSWDVYSSGPSHQVVWTAITYIRGVQYAKCVSTRQNAAMEDAAQQTLNVLYADRMRGY
ncbi:hypothetical protein BDW22DRAFT_1354991 [Trametopsis cervina]|nr:hypothetical protein BDW22DRAFT_1354991 [Trametopsis cervina]